MPRADGGLPGHDVEEIGQEREEGNDEYRLMLLLERLESLREDMLELGVRSLEEVERRIEELHRRLDEL